jgi:hypothetical protein
MRKNRLILASGLLLSLLASSAKAVNINLVNVDLASPESQRASQLYGNAYGFPPEQVTPALVGPPEEVPAILQVAQAAGTVPLSVWMMRKMGMSYSRILQTFAVAPQVNIGVPLTDPVYIETSRVHFLRDVLEVSPTVIPLIPVRGPEFLHFIVTPYHPQVGYWMPPGIAKKYGYWMPPGQAKKYWWGEDWDHDHWRHGDDDDQGHDHGRGKWKDDHWKKEKWEAKRGHEDHDDWRGGHGHDHGHDHDHGHGHGKHGD